VASTHSLVVHSQGTISAKGRAYARDLETFLPSDVSVRTVPSGHYLLPGWSEGHHQGTQQYPPASAKEFLGTDSGMGVSPSLHMRIRLKNFMSIFQPRIASDSTIGTFTPREPQKGLPGLKTEAICHFLG